MGVGVRAGMEVVAMGVVAVEVGVGVVLSTTAELLQRMALTIQHRFYQHHCCVCVYYYAQLRFYGRCMHISIFCADEYCCATTTAERAPERKQQGISSSINSRTDYQTEQLS